MQVNGGACSPSLYGTLKDDNGEVITYMGKPPTGLRAWFNRGEIFDNWCIFHNAASCRDVPCRGANSCQLADPCQDGACPGTWSPVPDGTWCIEEEGGRCYSNPGLQATTLHSHITYCTVLLYLLTLRAILLTYLPA